MRAASTLGGLLYGCGDAVIGINPASDNTENIVRLLHILDRLRTEYDIPTQSCILTHSPSPGNTDETRNCISNIRSGGMDYETAARKCAYLLEQSLHIGYSGVRLKDSMPANYLPFTSVSANEGLS